MKVKASGAFRAFCFRGVRGFLGGLGFRGFGRILGRLGFRV